MSAVVLVVDTTEALAFYGGLLKELRNLGCQVKCVNPSGIKGLQIAVEKNWGGSPLIAIVNPFALAPLDAASLPFLALVLEKANCHPILFCEAACPSYVAERCGWRRGQNDPKLDGFFKKQSSRVVWRLVQRVHELIQDEG